MRPIASSQPLLILAQYPDAHLPGQMLEANTPLIALPRLAEKLCRGIEQYAKYEGLKPTGFFKDHRMMVAVNAVVRRTAETMIYSSTGNRAVSAAAHATCAGLG